MLWGLAAMKKKGKQSKKEMEIEVEVEEGEEKLRILSFFLWLCTQISTKTCVFCIFEKK